MGGPINFFENGIPKTSYCPHGKPIQKIGNHNQNETSQNRLALVGKGDCILSYLFNLHTEYIHVLREAEVGEPDHDFKIEERNINSLCYAEDNTQLTEGANNLQVLLMKVEEHNEKNGTKVKYKEDQIHGNR